MLPILDDLLTQSPSTSQTAMSYSVPTSGLEFSCLDYIRVAQPVQRTPELRRQNVGSFPVGTEISNRNQSFTFARSSVNGYQMPSISTSTMGIDADYLPHSVPVSQAASCRSSCAHSSHNSRLTLPAGLGAQELIQNGLLPQLETMQLMKPDDRKFKASVQLSAHETARKQIRQEKNKLAAAKCRNKRREFSKNLKEEHEVEEKRNSELKEEVARLTATIRRLHGLLRTHGCSMTTKQLEGVESRMRMAAKENTMEHHSRSTQHVSFQGCRLLSDETVSNWEFSDLLGMTCSTFR